MTPAPRVLDEDDLPGADAACLAVARGELDARVEIDDVLPPRGWMPVEVVVGRHLAEDDPGGGEAGRIGAGEILLVEDTSGKGHLSKAFEGKVRRCVLVTLD